MSFNLADPADFARITLSDASQAANALKELRGDDRWDIQEGSYKASDSNRPILFHVFTTKEDYQAAVPSIQDTGGRRKIKYQYPYRDGQTTNDIGRAALHFNVDIVFHGTNYLEAFKLLLNEMNKPVPGELVHPVMGRFQCVMETYEVTHNNSMRKAMTVKVNFTEHNFSIGSLDQLSDIKSFKKAISDATTLFSLLDNAIAVILNAIFLPRTLRDRLVDSIRIYADQVGRILVAMNTAFNFGGVDIDLPNLRPTNQSGGTDGGDTFPVVSVPDSPITSVPTTVTTPTPTSAAVAVEDIKKQMDTSRQALSAIIVEMKASADGQGALEFYDQILDMERTAILQQSAFEAGVKTSRARIIEYTAPRVMSLREVSFLNGISFDQLKDLDQLNPGLDSVNYIAAGTVVRLPLI